MDQTEIEFVRMAHENSVEENRTQGGLEFPFLQTVQWQEPRLLLAVLIPTKQPPHFMAFACLTLTQRGKTEFMSIEQAILRRKYNGIFFPPDELALAQEGLVHIVYHRVLANISLAETTEPSGIVTLRSHVSPNVPALAEFFREKEAVRLFKRDDLRWDEDLPF